jgi:hypothetical protein
MPLCIISKSVLGTLGPLSRCGKSMISLPAVKANPAILERTSNGALLVPGGGEVCAGDAKVEEH